MEAAGAYGSAYSWTLPCQERNGLAAASLLFQVHPAIKLNTTLAMHCSLGSAYEHSRRRRGTSLDVHVQTLSSTTDGQAQKNSWQLQGRTLTHQLAMAGQPQLSTWSAGLDGVHE